MEQVSRLGALPVSASDTLPCEGDGEEEGGKGSGQCCYNWVPLVQPARVGYMRIEFKVLQKHCLTGGGRRHGRGPSRLTLRQLLVHSTNRLSQR